MPYDLLLKGGTLVDPAQSLHATRDIAFAGGIVAAVAPELPADQATTVVDCTGLLVTPGLIDLHVHVYWGVSHFGIWPDDHCIAKGVTTAVDAGSAGADTFPGFRKFIVEASATRLFATLNISSQGMLNAEIGEFTDIKFARVDRALQTIERNRDIVLGVKVRLTRNAIVSAASGMRPLYLAREAADAAKLPLMVHPQDAWSGSIDDILAVMGKGDIITHCFHKMPCGIFDDHGRIRDSVLDARERGVLFDVGHGAGSFSWPVAESALEQGFLPTTISSDLHVYNVEGPVYDLITTAAKFMHMGLSLEDTLARVTSTPAAVIEHAGKLGTLAVGAWGDAVAFRLETGSFPLVDSAGVVRQGSQRLVPVTVVRGGAVYTPPAHPTPHPHAYPHHHHHAHSH
jgi:dihydroorotase